MNRELLRRRCRFYLLKIADAGLLENDDDHKYGYNQRNEEPTAGRNDAVDHGDCVMLLIFQGIFRAVVAVAVRFPNWIWLLLSGVVTFLLGLSIWHQWPLSGLWVIGLFVGVEMIFNGWSLVMLGLVAKNLPTAPAAK